MQLEPPRRAALVGRSADITRLAEAIGLRSAERRATAVLLSGDAGVGKTRLVTELGELAVSEGWTVLVGHCLDLGEGALPYLPFNEAFGRLAAQAPATADALVAQRPVLTKLMPRRWSATEARSESRQPRVDRAVLFEALDAALGQLAEEQPLLFVVEDVHWADESTRDLLSFLITRTHLAPVVVLASYRSDDLHRRHPLRAAVAAWSRLPGIVRQPLAPLPDADVRALVKALHPAPLSEGQLRLILDRAEGNAFFTEELVAATELGAGPLPKDLAALLLVRLDQLDDAARQLVRAASVAGRRVTHGLLAHVVELEPPALDRAVRAAVESNVLVAVGSSGYAFRHALLAEAVYDDLLPGELVRLHAAYAHAMSERAALGTAAELARHARAANDLATATRASIQAGDEAMELAAPAEAARHYEAALELLGDEPGDGEAETGVGTVELVVRAADALSASGDVFRAVALVQDALGRLPVDALPEQRANLLLALARAALYEEANAGINVASLTTRALALVPADPPTPLRARVVNMHARAKSDLRRDDEAARWAREAAHLGRLLHLPDVAADAATTLAQLEQRAGDPEAARRQLEETIAAARAADQLSVELRSLYHLGGLHYELGRLVEARSAYEHATRRAAETGRQWAPYGLDARAMAAIAAHVAGDWGATLDMVDVRGESPPGFAEAMLTAVGLSVSAGRGEIGAIERLGALRRWWDRDGMMAILAAGAGIDLHGDRGDLDAARRLHDEAVRHVGELWQQPWFQARLRLGALLLGQIGSAAARSPTASRAALASLADDVYVGVRQTAEAGTRSGRPRGPEGKAWIARAAAEHARVRWLTGVDPPSASELVGAWEEAGEAFDAFPHVFEHARSRARLASSLRAMGRTQESSDQVALAWAEAERLAAEPLLEELRAIEGGRAHKERPATQAGGALTTREREVLALLGDGRSNREIAGHLFITAKTASVHVSNIMAKLGAASRTEAVAVARRRGLLADTAAPRP